MKDLKKWFEDQKIEPIQDRNDGMDYYKNYELFTYNDLMECMEALLILHGVGVNEVEFCDVCKGTGVTDERWDKKCEGCFGGGIE